MRIVIIGSGIAGITFASKMRELANDAKITLLTWENFGYYSRPLLSHGFSKTEIEQRIILKNFDAYQQQNIEILSNVSVQSISRVSKSLSFKQNTESIQMPYDWLILAPGSSAFIPPPLLRFRESFYVLNSLYDLKKLRKRRFELLQANKKPNWAIIGGGLIGCEVASDLNLLDDDVTIYHATDRLMERQLAETDSQRLLRLFQDKGINVLCNQHINEINSANQDILITSNDLQTQHDSVIVSCGFQPRVELAEQAGLKTNRGILVNEFLQTTDESIYAIGDAAELPGKHIYAFILPIRNQAIWLAEYLTEKTKRPWQVPEFTPRAKIHDFTV